MKRALTVKRNLCYNCAINNCQGVVKDTTCLKVFWHANLCQGHKASVPFTHTVRGVKYILC